MRKSMGKQWNLLTVILLVTALILCGCSTQEKKAKDTKAAVRLEDDFYEYENHELLAKTEIPPDAKEWSVPYELREDVYQKLNQILEDTVSKEGTFETGTAQQRIADTYANIIDYKGRNAAGLGGLKANYDEISEANNITEYLHAIASLMNVYGTSSLLNIGSDVDIADSTKYAAYVWSPDLVLGKEQLEDPESEELRSDYIDYIQKIFLLLGHTEKEAKQKADGILAFQKDLASSTLTMQDAQNPSHFYNPYTKEELYSLFSNIPLAEILPATGMGDWNQYIVTDVKSCEKMNQYLTEEHLQLLKDYSVFILLNDYGSYLTEEFADNYALFTNKMQGGAERATKEKEASQMVQNLLPWDFGKLYASENFSLEKKQAVETMAKAIIQTYDTRIDSLSWMSDATKTAAKVKLAAIDIKIGFPDDDKWPKDMEQVHIKSPKNGGTLIDTRLLISKAITIQIREMEKEPVDRGLWTTTPQTVNAFYNPSANEIVFPAAILQSPFYDEDAEYAVNLGGIGSVIAHEVTHAFDSNGAQYDENGNMKDWWTKADYENFEKLTAQVVDYYNGFEVFKGRSVDGAATISENIADLGAMNCVATLIGDDKKELKKLFESNAHIWAYKASKERQLYVSNTDVHAPAKVRVNAVLGATQAFYETYDIKETDDMYIAPKQRPVIW